MPITVESAVAALGSVVDPYTQRPLADVKLVRDVEVEGDSVSLAVDLTSPADPHK